MRRGFTLVEIMLVTAIIALILAIAIPNFLRAHIEANESATQAALKTIVTAEVTYRTANSNYGTLTQLGSGSVPYVDNVLADGRKNGYDFNVIVGTQEFVANALPVAEGRSGIRKFCITEDGILRTNSGIISLTTHAECQSYSVIVQ